MKSGFVELQHTADLAIKVWAPDYYALLREAARGMYALMSLSCEEPELVNCHFKIQGIDRESWMVAFLSELLFLYEKDGMAFDTFAFEIKNNSMEVQASGAKVKMVRKEIKAATFHNLEIIEGDSVLEAVIVFDV